MSVSPNESNLKNRRNLQPLAASESHFQHSNNHSSSSLDTNKTLNSGNQALDAKSPYGSISQGFRKVVPHEMACKLGCKGKKCKYETSNWPAEDMVIPGIFSHWITDDIVAMSRPRDTLIKNTNFIDKMKEAGIKSIFNLQTRNEHKYCGDGILESTGFSYDPIDFEKNEIYYYNYELEDYSIGSKTKMLDMVKVFDFSLSQGKVAVHCHAGLGRTGLLIACSLIYSKRMNANDAIHYIREKRQNSVQMDVQIACAKEFENYLKPLRVVYCQVLTNASRSLNIETAESHLFTSFSLNTFLIRQRLLTHGLESKKFKYIPKILYICSRKLIKLIKNSKISSNSLTVPNQRSYSNAESSYSLNEIAEALLRSDYSSKLMKKILQYQKIVNEENEGFEILYKESNPVILSAMIWTWIEHLKEPVIRDQEISFLLSYYRDNSKAESNWDVLDKSVIETVNCLLNLIREFLPLEEQMEIFLIDKLIASLTHTQIKSENRTSINESENLKQLPHNKYLLIKSIFKNIIEKPVNASSEKSPRFSKEPDFKMMEELSPVENVFIDETGQKATLNKNNATYSQTSESNESGFFNESSRLHALELEQEQLNASLMALTTHFGQVQFRLKQIVVAPEPDKEHLLKELEEFAFKGCPVNNSVNNFHQNIIEEQRMKQKDLIHQLRDQLEDIQSYSFQSENLSDVPSIIEKQKIVIDELKEKINLPLENMDKLSNDELKKVVDKAICQIVNPVKVKEQLVGQLKTQIEDLERFIDFLQGEASSPGPYLQKKNCNCSKNNCEQQSESAFPVFNQPQKNQQQDQKYEPNQSNQSTVDLLKKILSVMQIFAISQLNCGSKNTFEKNSLKKSSNHWGDLRANLELSINKILNIDSNYNETKKMSLYANAESDEEIVRECPQELIKTIRKDFACSLRDLMQHGLIESSNSSSMVPFGCFVVRSKESVNQMHIWDLFIKYYDAKHGKEFTQSAANKLSQSFNLNVVGGKVITIKQSLLNSIETVLRIHGNSSVNKDSCFKAFVCLSLNEKKLALYLKQILKATVIIENYYQNWSYVKTTGFDDALKSIDQLKCLNWNLPVEKSKRRKSTKANDLF